MFKINGLGMVEEREKPQDTPAEFEIQAALERLTAWSDIAASKRSKGLLVYLCKEVLEERGDEIRAKTIALDHYGYSAEELIDRESVVRVDVGRLRRRLEEYYGGSGQDDPLRISLPKGSYKPEISYRPNAPIPLSLESEPKRRQFKLLTLVATGAIIAAAAGIVLKSVDQTDPRMNDGLDMLERTAVFDVSPIRLQAMNLADEGRKLVFPAVEPARLKAALAVFDAAVETDQTYFGGHAGRAQTLTVLALLTPDKSDAEPILATAEAAVKRALELAPDEAWSQSARAWFLFAKRDYEQALALSSRAMKLAPDDPHIVEFDALISLFSGQFERVVAETERILTLLDEDTGFVFTNALGSAKFHLGDDEATIRAFEDSIRRGGPVGPFTLSYMMAAKHRLGDVSEARELSRTFQEGWPDSRIDMLVQRLFANPEHPAELLREMKGAGWSY